MKYLFVAILLSYSLCLSAQNMMEFKSTTQELKNLKAEDQDTTVVTYTFKNTGNQPIIINRVTSLSASIKAQWTTGPIAPGKKGEITLSFIPIRLPDHFSIKTYVYTNKGGRTELSLNGNIIDNPAKPELLYKYNLDGLKFRLNSVNFNKIYTWQVVQDTLHFFNTRKDSVKLGLLYHPNYINATFIPEQVAPGEKGVIIISLDAPKKNDYGYVYESIILSYNNSRDYKNRLSINAYLTEDFGKLSAEELSQAPVATIDKTEINFGDIKPGDKANCDFQLTNTGKRTLIIRKTRASCGCTAVTLGQKEIAPGQTITIRATFDSKGKSGRQFKTVTVITNDPKTPEQSLHISGNILKN